MQAHSAAQDYLFNLDEEADKAASFYPEVFVDITKRHYSDLLTGQDSHTSHTSYTSNNSKSNDKPNNVANAAFDALNTMNNAADVVNTAAKILANPRDGSVSVFGISARGNSPFMFNQNGGNSGGGTNNDISNNDKQNNKNNDVNQNGYNYNNSMNTNGYVNNQNNQNNNMNGYINNQNNNMNNQMSKLNGIMNGYNQNGIQNNNMHQNGYNPNNFNYPKPKEQIVFVKKNKKKEPKEPELTVRKFTDSRKELLFRNSLQNRLNVIRVRKTQEYEALPEELRSSFTHVKKFEEDADVDKFEDYVSGLEREEEISQKVMMYEQGIKTIFFFVQSGLTYFGMNLSHFCEDQLTILSWYTPYLRKIAERQINEQAAPWPPELSIILMMVANAGFYLVVHYLLKSVGIEPGKTGSVVSGVRDKITGIFTGKQTNSKDSNMIDTILNGMGLGNILDMFQNTGGRPKNNNFNSTTNKNITHSNPEQPPKETTKKVIDDTKKKPRGPRHNA